MRTDTMIGLIVAPFVGSFLGLIIDRLPTGRPIVVGRSICNGCGCKLSWVDLIPVLSFLHLRGRCRHCNEPFSAFYPIIELAAVAIVVSAAFVSSGGLLFWFSVGLGWCLLVLAVIDHHHLILPDQLTIPLIPIGLGVAYLVNPRMIDDHLIGAVVGLLAFVGIAWLYHALRGRDGLGLGDAKLLAGAGAWLGWAALPGVVLLASCTALFLALLNSFRGDKAGLSAEISFGPHLALAFWMSWLLGPLILA